jgi:SNF2 family DNA or RNA helicase
MKRIAGRPFIAQRDKQNRIITKNIEELKAEVDRVGITVKLSDVLELPERTFIVKKCWWEPELAKIYRALRKNYVAEFKTEEISAQNAAVLSARLLRLTSGLGHANFEVKVENPKLKELMLDIGSYAAVGKCIVWSVWLDERHEAFAALQKENYKVTFEPNDFLNGDFQILVASPKMFGTGLNLQIAKYQLWLSRTWSLVEREQALARNYRAGQNDKTIVIDYVLENTIDESVLIALENKSDLLNAIMENGVTQYV